MERLAAVVIFLVDGTHNLQTVYILSKTFFSPTRLFLSNSFKSLPVSSLDSSVMMTRMYSIYVICGVVYNIR